MIDLSFDLLPPSPDIRNRLFRFEESLRLESRKQNLVSREDLPFLTDRHILDSLAPELLGLLPTLTDRPCLDLGCGAGFPLIPLAISRPDLKWVGWEPRPLRVRYLEGVVRLLELTNVQIHPVDSRSPAARLVARGGFPVILSRAVAPVVEDARLAAPHLSEGGVWISFRTTRNDQKIDGWNPPSYTPYRLPGEQGTRVLRRATPCQEHPEP